MTTTMPTHGLVARRFGFGIAAAIQIVFLWVVNVWPGWEAVPFLTPEAARVVWLVNLSLVVGLVVNLAYIAYDAPWFRAAGDVVTTAVGLAVLLRIWTVFPFQFTDPSVDWALIARWSLVFVIAMTILGLIVQFVRLIRAVIR